MTLHRPILTVLALAAALCSPARVTAQPAGAPTPAEGQRPPITLDAGKRGVILDSLYANLVRTYVEEDTARRRIELLTEWIEAKDRGTPVDAARAASVVGAYDGERTVTLRDRRLYYQRGRSPASELIPLASCGYSFDGDARIRFADGVPAGGMAIELNDGSKVSYARIEGK